MPVKVKEFDVVIMAAGKGSRLSDITQRKPKCLLPVGNFFMVYFPIKLFEYFGFVEVYLVVLEMDKIVVESAIEKSDIRLKINLITIPDDKDWGTADTLRYMHSHSYFTHDIIVASCDLVTNIDLNKVFQFHRKSDCSITAVYFPFKKVSSDFTVPGRSSKVTIEKDILALVPKRNEIVFVGSLSEFGETINLSHKLIKKYRNIQLRSDLQDAHLYIIKRAIVNFLLLEGNKDMSTLKGDVLPFVVKKQSSSKNKYSNRKTDSTIDDLHHSTEAGDICSSVDPDVLIELCKQSEYAIEATLLSSHNTNDGDLRASNSARPIKCCAYMADEDVIMIRANTMYGYCSINHVGNKIFKQLPGLSSVINVGAIIESPCKIDRSTCFIGNDSTILSNVFMKATTVGWRCLLKSNSRINNCVIMDDVVINEQCTLSNCVICDNVTINTGSVLNNCIVCSNQIIPINSSFIKDVLTETGNLMEM